MLQLVPSLLRQLLEEPAFAACESMKLRVLWREELPTRVRSGRLQMRAW